MTAQLAIMMKEVLLRNNLICFLPGCRPNLAAIMMGWVHFTDHLCVVALGIEMNGTKH